MCGGLILTSFMYLAAPVSGVGDDCCTGVKGAVQAVKGLFGYRTASEHIAVGAIVIVGTVLFPAFTDELLIGHVSSLEAVDGRHLMSP